PGLLRRRTLPDLLATRLVSRALPAEDRSPFRRRRYATIPAAPGPAHDRRQAAPRERQGGDLRRARARIGARLRPVPATGRLDPPRASRRTVRHRRRYGNLLRLGPPLHRRQLLQGVGRGPHGTGSFVIPVPRPRVAGGTGGRVLPE